jgi:CheY-like chemotaxis protein
MPHSPESTAGAILIVDDNSDDAILTRYALTKLPLRNPVHIVSTAEEMIAYLEGKGVYQDRVKFRYPALILLDLKLPQMTGLQAQAWLRTSLKHRQIPVVVISNDMSLVQLETAVKFGANGYLVKPVRAADFAALCRNMQIRLDASQL